MEERLRVSRLLCESRSIHWALIELDFARFLREAYAGYSDELQFVRDARSQADRLEKSAYQALGRKKE